MMYDRVAYQCGVGKMGRRRPPGAVEDDDRPGQISKRARGSGRVCVRVHARERKKLCSNDMCVIGIIQQVLKTMLHASHAS